MHANIISGHNSPGFNKKVNENYQNNYLMDPFDNYVTRLTLACRELHSHVTKCHVCQACLDAKKM